MQCGGSWAFHIVGSLSGKLQLKQSRSCGPPCRGALASQGLQAWSVLGCLPPVSAQCVIWSCHKCLPRMSQCVRCRGCLLAGVEWAGEPGLSKVVSCLGCSDPASVHVIKVKGNWNHGSCQHLATERDPAPTPPHLGGGSRRMVP